MELRKPTTVAICVSTVGGQAIDARNALARSRYREVRTVRCDHADCGIVLSGQVSSYFHKQMAQEEAFGVGRGSSIQNSLIVNYPFA